MTFATENAEILALFAATNKTIPESDSDMGKAVQILQTICKSQAHTIPEIESDTSQDDAESEASEVFEALGEIGQHIGKDDFMLDFDGAEYRLINNDAIWPIYRDAIQHIVEDCYSDVINLDKVPSFIAVNIDWEQTAKNAYVDGCGHTFSGYDGSEEQAAGYYIFRTN